MYLEEERSEVISCIFSLKEEVGALAKALRLFEVTLTWNITPPGTQLIFSHFLVGFYPHSLAHPPPQLFQLMINFKQNKAAISPPNKHQNSSNTQEYLITTLLSNVIRPVRQATWSRSQPNSKHSQFAGS